ncbi:Chromosome partitioning ATPase, Mrp family, contains Fe-S cluster [Dethiosulfovibrio salsuginis]|uniref:Iron-sulfur cluster carrier protein n=1 Tax=Dethiosulfovibrio salsuginis TaxID=561720 RepID=A0A1X7JMB0_9BACT|nr:Chromosome partitioning ATPase, Mrp family, contains Fe-S cluster [Dethiosulfovibrio salsuginis]
MEDKDSCNGVCEGCPSQEGCSGAPKPSRKGIKRIVAVGSGKGGVGKSSVSALLAVGLAKRGFSVGVMDADITGPSIPKLFGVDSRPSGNGEGKIIPPKTDRLGISIMSMNLLLDDPKAPVVWRGPLIGGVVQQFWNDVDWNGLDWLVVDLPPGTADAPLTVMQTVALDGMVIVSTPQELSALIVGKQARLAEMMNVPIMGMVENMSHVVCPHCGEELRVFGESHSDQIESNFGISTLARIPISSEIASLGDRGLIEDYDNLSLLNELVDGIV